MVRVFSEEVKKIIINPGTLAFCVFLFILNAMAFEIFDKNPRLYTAESYKEVFNRLEGLEPAEALKKLDTLQDDTAGTASDLPRVSSLSMRFLLEQIRTELKDVYEYAFFRENIRKNAQAVTTGPFGVKKSSFAYRNATKTVRDYDAMPDVHLKTGPSLGINSFLNIRYTDWLLLFMAAYCVFLMLTAERNSGNMLLTATTRYGGKKHAMCKLGAVCVVSSAFTFLLCGYNLVITAVKYGFGDTVRGIQSVNGMRNCILPVSVRGYLVIFFLSKAVAVVSFACIVYAVACALKRALIQYIVTVAFFAAEYAASVLITDQSYIAFLKNINVYSFLDIKNTIGIYKNINLFGFPVYYPYVFAAAVIVSLIFAVVFVIIFYEKNVFLSGNDKGKVLFRTGMHCHTILHEAYKQLICGGGLLVVALLFLVTPSITGSNGEVIISEEELVYKRYMIKYEGYCTAETLNILDGEKRRIEELRSMRDEEMRNASSEAEIFFLQNKYSGIDTEFNVVKNVIDHGKFLVEHNGAFFYDNGYKVLFGKRSFLNKNKLLAVTLMIFIVLACSFCYGHEYSTGMTGLIYATKTGPVHIFRQKLIVCTGIVTAMYLMLYCTYIYVVLTDYGVRGLGYPVSSIEGMPLWNMSVLSFIIFLSVFRYVLFVISIPVIFFISRLTKNYVFTLLIGLLVCCGAVIVLHTLFL